MIKEVALFDLHMPKHNAHCLDIAVDFIRDFKPNKLILGGDFLNLSCISHWKEGQIGDQLGEDIDRDYDMANDALDRLMKGFKGEVIYIMGNHEDWIRQYAQIYPSIANIIKLDRNLKVKERGIKIIPLNEVYFVGKLGFTHGLYTGDHHTLKTIRAGYNCSLRYGHTHDRQVDTQVAPVDKKHHHTVESCGCLCDMNPDYMKSKPSKWIHGLQFGYVDEKSGYFNDYFAKINDSKTIILGKEYK